MGGVQRWFVGQLGGGSSTDGGWGEWPWLAPDSGLGGSTGGSEPWGPWGEHLSWENVESPENGKNMSQEI